jgi:hypothetical protein
MSDLQNRYAGRLWALLYDRQCSLILFFYSAKSVIFLHCVP